MAYDKLLMLDNMGHAFTAKASRVTSGGELIGFFGGTDVVGSVSSTYVWDDISVGSVVANGLNCVGVAITSASSGAAIGVATQGLFILPAGSNAVSGGEPVYAAGYANMVIGGAAGSLDGRLYRGIGRALTAGTALSGFAVVRLSV